MNTNMDNWQMAFGLISGTVLLILFLAVTAVELQGEHYRPSGTMYMEGQGCILSMTSDSSILTINEDQVWCMEMHLQYLSSLK